MTAPGMAHKMTGGCKRSSASKVDVPLAHIRAEKASFQFVADIETVRTLREKSFDMRLKHTDKCSVIGDSGDDGIEHFPDAMLHGNRSQALGHFSFDLAGSVFLQSAVGGDGGEFGIGVRIRLSVQHRLDQPLGNNIGETTVRSCGMRVILDSETEVSLGCLTGALQNVFPWTDKLDNRQGKVGEVVGIGGLAA